MTTLVGARAHFCAAHKLPQHAETHGHSYEVWAFTAMPVDAEQWQRDLQAVCRELDHKMLEPNLATMERIAEWIGDRINAKVIRVVRPVEGLSAEVVK
jgi:6-pyruvoyl-tetrahydropterin synthase